MIDTRDKLVLDLEFCSGINKEYKQKVKNHHEIIEIGLVLLDSNFNIKRKLNQRVKPMYSNISSYVTDITGITDEDLEGMPNIETALNMICDVIESDTVLCTWSNMDTHVIIKELEAKGIHNKKIIELCENYIDIQELFDKELNFNKQVNLERALELVGIDFEGNAHNALTDAINTMKIYKALSNSSEVRKIINKINTIMKAEPLKTSLGSMFDFSSLEFN